MYIRHFIWTTNCVLDLFDEISLLRMLPAWIQMSGDDDLESTALIYLVLAIGIDAATEGDENVAHDYYQYGRHLTANRLLAMGPSIYTTQCDVLITWYLLGNSQSNAAYMHIGTAIRAAYTLDLHKKPVAGSWKSDESHARERLWKSIRVLDGFLSQALGRPTMNQADGNDDRLHGHYSAVSDLCTIFETVRDLVYAKRVVSFEVVQQIGTKHRRWSNLFRNGLEADCISSADTVTINGRPHPNLGLYYLKEAYFWTVSQLTLPFLIDLVSERILEQQYVNSRHPKFEHEGDRRHLAVHACIDAAVNTLDMIQQLMSHQGALPRRMPIVVNSVFFSALTIGFAVFGDLDYEWPLMRYLGLARTILLQLAIHDSVAQEQVEVVTALQKACDNFLCRRSHRGLESCTSKSSNIFGNIRERWQMADCSPMTNSTIRDHTGPMLSSDYVSHDPTKVLCHPSKVGLLDSGGGIVNLWGLSHTGDAEEEVVFPPFGGQDWTNMESLDIIS
ncbi:uncharacterized protein AB675_46 [Cyphellophora attinorum]|uniref:Xylanolytic transcriptional activator regulatory domain-containing protein n=1 Tax=Cyphellophora attinorum TaxID=1664694 RepID=A0A0N0NHL0_9EURO|nr:uncharacterized protein AB675_46 [Phialophora attinorum]KPI34688.1 hypothetical protein AB675_46 [Phialophora attinorum]